MYKNTDPKPKDIAKSTTWAALKGSEHTPNIFKKLKNQKKQKRKHPQVTQASTGSPDFELRYKKQQYNVDEKERNLSMRVEQEGTKNSYGKTTFRSGEATRVKHRLGFCDPLAEKKPYSKAVA